jgi:hypothetical protein
MDQKRGLLVTKLRLVAKSGLGILLRSFGVLMIAALLYVGVPSVVSVVIDALHNACESRPGEVHMQYAGLSLFPPRIICTPISTMVLEYKTASNVP